MSTAALASRKYSFGNYRTYLAAIAFIGGNIVVPQLCHLIPNGGLMFLPIYFFTLVAAFRCGWKVGLLTAVDFSLLSVALAVLAYQLVGMTVEFFMDFNFMHAIQDIRIGWPGILIQIVGGYLVIKALQRK